MTKRQNSARGNACVAARRLPPGLTLAGPSAARCASTVLWACFVCGVLALCGCKSTVLEADKPSPWLAGTAHNEYAKVVRSKSPGLWTGAPGYRVISGSNDSRAQRNVCEDPVRAEWEPRLEHPEAHWLRASEREGQFELRPGFQWDDATESSATWTSGLPHSDYPNLESGSADTDWRPTRGYRFENPSRLYSPGVARDLRTVLKPGWTVAKESGSEGASTATEWLSGREFAEFPHVRTGDDEDTWMPSPGYALIADGSPQVEWRAGESDPEAPNQRSGLVEGTWIPAPGYEFNPPESRNAQWTPGLEHICPWDPSKSREGLLASATEGQWEVAPGFVVAGTADGLPVPRWIPQRRFKSFPHLVTGEQPGEWTPDPGFVAQGPLATERSLAPPMVFWRPGTEHLEWKNMVAAATPGVWKPSPGFTAVDPRRQESGAVWTEGVTYPNQPHIRASADIHRWNCAAGYSWVEGAPWEVPGAPFEVEWKPGLQHPKAANVVAGGLSGTWSPKAGYMWDDESLDPLAVLPAAGESLIQRRYDPSWSPKASAFARGVAWSEGSWVRPAALPKSSARLED